MLKTQDMGAWSLGQEDPLGQATPVFLPGEAPGQRSLAGYRQTWCEDESWAAEFSSTDSEFIEPLLYTCYAVPKETLPSTALWLF